MNGKVVAVIAVAVVAVLAGAAVIGFVVLNKDKEPSSDYTLLDKTEVSKGLFYSVEYTYQDTYDRTKMKVTDVSDTGKVSVSYTNEYRDNSEKPLTLSDFVLTFFNPDDTAPEGVTVTKTSGEIVKYEITGEYTISETSGSRNESTVNKFEDVVMEVAPTSQITSASGKITVDFSDESKTSPDTDYTKVNHVWKLSTVDGQGMVSMVTDYKEERTVVYTNYNEMKNDFDQFTAAAYPGCEIKTETATYGGVECDKYIIKGESVFDSSKLDIVMYVYNGYIIHGEGKVDDKDEDYNVKIYNS